MAHERVDYQPEVRIRVVTNSLAMFGIKYNYRGAISGGDSITDDIFFFL